MSRALRQCIEVAAREVCQERVADTFLHDSIDISIQGPTIGPMDYIKPEWNGFYAGKRDEFNTHHFYQKTYGEVPSSISGHGSYTDALLALLKKEGDLICETISHDDKGRPNVGLAYIMSGEMIHMLSRDSKGYSLDISYRKGQTPDLKRFDQFIAKDKKTRISLLVKEYGEIVATPFDMDVPEKLDLELNYGTGFTKSHDKIVAGLQTSKSSLFLFHGSPGSGKTSYVKYLSSQVEREFVYVPVGMASSLASPDMLSFFISKRGCVLVLEDAEKVVADREFNGNTDVVSTLLNMADGILGNVLNISIIATYNAERETVDKAFLRKGRLKFEHEFKALSVDDTNRLLASLGHPAGRKEMTLAEIYNLEAETGHVEKEQRSMGFLPVTRK